MKAVLYRTSGGSEVLTVTEAPTPEAAPGEVLVRLQVAGVNPTDWKRRTTAAPDGFQIPGQDGAGVIEAVGEGVDRSRVGQRVWVWLAARPPLDEPRRKAPGRRYGTAAQYTVVPSAQAVPLPDAVSFDAGAGFGVPAVTAWHCLAGGPVDGANVLVAGGAGAVGNMAIALARRLGANVVSTVSGPEKAALATAAGAHTVVNYRDADAAAQIRAAAPDGIDHIVEVALGANLELDLAVLAPRGSISTYADDPLPDLPVRRLMVGNVVLRFVLLYGLTDAALAAAADGVAAVAPVLPVLSGDRFDLGATARAHDAVQSGALGKVLLDIP
ncbi:MAG: NADPH:quinone reductase [Geodermatophilaceae bacterium]|nr:NADPH:quinone reductase [Geodermatophilaceae bacterium]